MRVSQRRLRACLTLAGQAALFSVARASITYNTATSTVTFTHTEDRNPANGEVIHPNVAYTETPTASVPASPTFQLANNFSSDGGNSQTTADVSLAEVTNALDATFNLAPGTGITQTNLTGYYNGQSQLTINFNMNWTVGSGGFVDPSAYVSFNVAGNLTSGDSVVVVSNPSAPLTFTAVNGANTYTVEPSISFTDNTVGSFFQTLVSNQFINGGATLPSGSKLSLTGQLLFRAKDPGGPATMSFAAGEVGSAPATDQSTVVTNGNWSNAANWRSDGLAPSVPGATDEPFPVRAEFGPQEGQGDNSATTTLDIPVTLSELDFSNALSVTIASDGTDDGVTFDPAFLAVIHVAAVAGSGQVIQPPLIAQGPSLDIQVDEPQASLTLQGETTAGASTPVTKLGGGTLVLDATNSISTFNASEGQTDAEAASSLGSVTTTVSGDLHYDANGASAAPVTVESNGEVDLGVMPTVSDVFDVKALGSIAGTDSQLAALGAANLTLEPGAIIVHQEPGGSDPMNVGTTAQLEYGIGSGFATDDGTAITIGTGSSTPWIGMAANQQAESFGQDPTASTDTLTIAGNADLVAQLNGVLNINAQLEGTGNITKDGEGDVELNHTGTVGFSGNFFVADGTLTVNDTLPAGDNITVGVASEYGAPPADPSDPPAVPTLCGTGSILGSVDVKSGGVLQPGTPSNPGLLTVNDLTMELGSTMQFRIGGQFDTDSLTINGNLNLDDATLDLIPMADFQPGIFVLFDYSGLLTGNFGQIIVPPGYSITPDFSKSGEFEADVEEVSEVAVPEPALLPLLGFAALGLRRRRSRARSRQ